MRYRASEFGQARFRERTSVPVLPPADTDARYQTHRYRRIRYGHRLVGVPATLSAHERTYSANWDDDRTMVLMSYAMTKTNVSITNLVIGDSKRIKRTYTGLPTGSTVSTAYFTAKRRETQADAAAVVQKTITVTAGSSGQVTTADTTDGEIALYFDLTATETEGFTAGVSYAYDIEVVLSGGEKHTMEKGSMTWINGITGA